MSQNIHLIYDHHFIINTLQNCITTETMGDVTLVCEGKSLKAHKLVLSACSPLFQTLILENPCKHPIIIFQDVKFTCLKALIDLMYHGGINITKENLPNLLRLTKTLRAKLLEEVLIAADESGNPSTSQSADEFEIQSGAVSASQLADESENPRSHETGTIGTPSPPKLEKIVYDNSKQKESGKVEPPVLDTLHLQSNSVNSACRSLKFLRIEETCGYVSNAETEEFEDRPLSQVEKMLTHDIPRPSCESSSQPKEQPLSNSDHSHKKQHTRLSHSRERHQSSPDCLRKKQYDSSSLDHSKERHENNPDRSTKKNHGNYSLHRSKKWHHSKSDNFKKKHQKSSTLDRSKEKHQILDLSKEHPQNISEYSRKKKDHNGSLDSSSPEHFYKFPPLIPTHTLPIVLCERMISVLDQHDTTPPATPKNLCQIPQIENGKQIEESENEGQIEESENEEQIEELENEGQIEEFENEGQIEESETEELQKTEKLPKKVVLKKKDKIKKFKRPYVRVPIAERQALYKIEKSPNGIRFYGCRQCSFATKYLESLKRHIIAKHQHLKRYKCDKCSYAATLKQHLKRHQVEVHEHLRQFQCHICPYKAVLKGGLKRHMDCVHEQKKPFMCEECGFRSSQKVNVRKHIIAIHEKRREYTCNLCTYRCAQSSGLKRHIKLVHEKTKK